MADDRRRGALNIPALFWGLIFAGMAVVGLTGSFAWVFAPATTWIVAGLAACVGIVLVLSGLPGRHRGR